MYTNRRHIRGRRGKRLLRHRGEYPERSFAHAYESGGLRWVRLRGRGNILKQLLVHVGGFNLSLVMRKLVGSWNAVWLAGQARGGLGAALESVVDERRRTAAPVAVGRIPAR